MTKANDAQVCERTEDLISFLYNELDELEAQNFEQHRRNCRKCDAEITSFGAVRQSVLAWRNQSLDPTSVNAAPSGPVSIFAPQKRSALAAIRGFFALSPWWMKGATAVATILFCVLAGLAIARLTEDAQPTNLSQAEVEQRMAAEVTKRVNAEIAAQREKNVSSVATTAGPTVERPLMPKPVKTQRDKLMARENMRKPLTRAERERLAADLRLTPDDDEDSLQLLGDRINR
jgi:hypothetical protein